MTYCLKVENLAFGYQANCALGNGLNFSCYKGETLAILGTNGRGKTTLLNTLSGLQSPLSGQVFRHGLIGVVPQSFNCPFAYSVFDLVLMGRSVHLGLFQQPDNSDRLIVQQTLEQLAIQHLAQQEYNALSGGQKQLVLIARALAMQCQTLLLDEPASALDLYNQQMVLGLIRQLANDQVSLIFTTHDPYHALIASDKTLILNQTSHHYGLSQQVLSEQNLSQTYQLEIKRARLQHNGDTHEVIMPLFRL